MKSLATSILINTASHTECNCLLDYVNSYLLLLFRRPGANKLLSLAHWRKWNGTCERKDKLFWPFHPHPTELLLHLSAGVA